MTPVVGIICEYDPFHRGHARQFHLVREKLPGARIVCVMSGPFTQRGLPALYSSAFRAHAALRAGADLVLELPCLFALREAENFALGGVSVLHGLGFVTHLSFGCENDDLALLQKAAEQLETPCAAFTGALKETLKSGQSFAAAQGDALCASLRGAYGDAPLASAFFSAPNNILAISYLRALLRLKSPVQPLPVLREGRYHTSDLAAPGYPSATAVRKALLAGDFSAAETACGYPFPAAPLCRPDALDQALLFTLRRMSPSELALLPDCTEGLENRLHAACREAASREELLESLKTKRYTYARLQRLLSHSLLSVTAGMQAEMPLPTYVRLLGFRQESINLLSRFNQSRLPVISKAAQGPASDAAYQLDTRAYDLWALGAGMPAGLMMTQQVVVI